MNRRDLVVGVGVALAAGPVGSRAQQKVPTVALFGSGTPSSQGSWVAAFVHRLGELGWIEKKTVVFEFRWAEGRSERFSEIASDLVRSKPDVIFALGTEAAFAAKLATTTIPIVFPVASDPVASGLVASLARPGGNITGLSNQALDLPSKRLGLLREVLPGLQHVAILANANNPTAVFELRETAVAAGALGLVATPLEIRSADDIGPSLATLKENTDALYVVGDPLMNTNRLRINTFALVARLPSMNVQREYVEVGALMSYGANYSDLNRRAAAFVDKILRGTKPGDIPVEQPTKFDLVINLSTAKALRLVVPPTLLARADDVIE